MFARKRTWLPGPGAADLGNRPVANHDPVVALRRLRGDAALNHVAKDQLRLPLVDATPEEESQVRDCLERAGLLTPAAA